jgi:eukaryotic-like serine/threonine-protein kinase
VKKLSSPSDVDKRAAALAIAQFGADRHRVDIAVQGVAQARMRGQNFDLVDLFVAQNLLTPAQAAELRHDLQSEPPEDPQQLSKAPRSEGEISSPSANGMPAAPSIPAGQQLRNMGEYRILRPLGQGGMGSVYLGYDENQKRQVAIKVLSEQLASNLDYVERFYREAKSGSVLDHPNIIRCIEARQDKSSGKHYLVMEYVDGPSAHALLDRMGRLPVGDAVHIALDIARGLEHVHSRNIVHRDIKPDNILVTRSGIGKLADLGLAKRLDEVSHLTGLRVGFGSVDYIPYEQAINAKQADGRSDIYALGATLYHLVTGQVPFPANNYMEIAEKKLIGNFRPASQLNSEVPAVLDRILEKMLARDPQGRYQMVSELIVDLERANLSAGVPTFTDPELALQDPLVRSRLVSPVQPTQLDLQSQTKKETPAKPEIEVNEGQGIWFLRFPNRDGQWIKTKMTTQQVLERLAEGRLGAEAEACPQPKGEFRSLEKFKEFREAMATFRTSRQKKILAGPSKETDPAINEGLAEVDKPNSRRVFLIAGLGLIVFAVIFFLVLKFLQ